MTKLELIALLNKIAEKIIAEKDYLTELDRPIGDNDHGINMARGFEAITKKLAELKDKDIGTIFKQSGMALVSNVGGSSGPLYGTAFMNVGKAMNQKEEIDLNDFVEILKVMIEGVKMRGKAELGEATMLDAMIPAYESLKAKVEQGSTAKEAIDEAYKAAKAGMESTIPVIATKGRASYVGERGIGHQDPGATSFTYMLEVVKDFVQ